MHLPELTSKEASPNVIMHHFLSHKNTILKYHLGIVLYTEDDMIDMEGWDADKCLTLLRNMAHCLRHARAYMLRTESCPWCDPDPDSGHATTSCDDCTYGKRNGVCHCKQSRYKLMVAAKDELPNKAPLNDALEKLRQWLVDHVELLNFPELQLNPPSSHSAKIILKTFCGYKNTLLNSYGLPLLYDKDDFQDISDRHFKQVTDMLKRLSNTETNNDIPSIIKSNACPWCLPSADGSKNMPCEACSYARRHGQCGDRGSTWYTLSTAVEKLQQANPAKYNAFVAQGDRLFNWLDEHREKWQKKQKENEAARLQKENERELLRVTANRNSRKLHIDQSMYYILTDIVMRQQWDLESMSRRCANLPDYEPVPADEVLASLRDRYTSQERVAKGLINRYCRACLPEHEEGLLLTNPKVGNFGEVSRVLRQALHKETNIEIHKMFLAWVKPAVEHAKEYLSCLGKQERIPEYPDCADTFTGYTFGTDAQQQADPGFGFSGHKIGVGLPVIGNSYFASALAENEARHDKALKAAIYIITEKHKLSLQYTGRYYYDPDKLDALITDIKEMPTVRLERAVNGLDSGTGISAQNCITDPSTCLWCRLHKDCSDCAYAKNHIGGPGTCATVSVYNAYTKACGALDAETKEAFGTALFRIIKYAQKHIKG